jgi:hypothetical protein
MGILRVCGHNITRIAALAAVSEPTVRRCYGGARTYATNRRRITEAARVLGLPLPPDAPRIVARVPCVACYGSGYSETDPSEPCAVCHGVGIVNG